MKSALRIFMAFSLIWCSTAFAQSITINAGQTPYSSVPAAIGVNVNSMVEIRSAALLALVGAYRTINGTFSIPIPSQIQIVYSDGSKELAAVTCLSGTPCVQPVPGTQLQASTSGGGGSGGGDPGGGGSYGGGGGCVASCGGSGGSGGGGTVIVLPPTKVV